MGYHFREIDGESGHEKRDACVERANCACLDIIVDLTMTGEVDDDATQTLASVLGSAADEAGIEAYFTVAPLAGEDAAGIKMTSGTDAIPGIELEVSESYADLAVVRRSGRNVKRSKCRIDISDGPDMLAVGFQLAVTSIINRIFASGLGRA